MKKAIALLAATAGLALGSSALAAPTFIFSVGDQLFVKTGAVMNQYSLSDTITGMAVAPNGTIYASSASDSTGSGFTELYTLNDVFGTPSLNLVGDFLSFNTTTLSFVGNQLYGFQTGGSLGNDHRLVTIDIGAQTDSVVGQTGIFGQNVGGSAYDPATDRLYTVINGSLPNASLGFIDDYTVAAPNDPTQTIVGQLGAPSVNGGAEFFQGVLYAILQTSGSASGLIDMTLGTIDTATGEFTAIETVLTDFAAPSGFPGARSVGFAVIPAPGTAAMLGLAGLLVFRRRR